MATVTIELDDDLARHVEDSARRENKSIAEWIKDQLRPLPDQIFATVEARALANGYPPGWLKLFGSLADDDTFAAPARGRSRSVVSIDPE